MPEGGNQFEQGFFSYYLICFKISTLVTVAQKLKIVNCCRMILTAQESEKSSRETIERSITIPNDQSLDILNKSAI